MLDDSFCFYILVNWSVPNLVLINSIMIVYTFFCQLSQHIFFPFILFLLLPGNSFTTRLLRRHSLRKFPGPRPVYLRILSFPSTPDPPPYRLLSCVTLQTRSQSYYERPCSLNYSHMTTLNS